MQLYSMPEDERCRAAMTMIKDLCSVFENRKVWFTINGFVDNYYISMYYDNGYNEASGEDL